jgi:uncharacterized alkaline shock family protein YloU
VNVFNRIFVVITSLGVGIAGAILLLVASGAVEARDVISSGWFYWRLQDLQNLTGTKETAAIIGLAAAVAAGTLLILVEYVNLALGAQPLSVTGEQNGRSKINTRSVERIVEEAAREVRGVSKVRPSMRRKGDGIIASCRASLEPGVMISDVAPQIEGKIRSAVESGTGLTVSAVRLNLEETHEKERAPAEVKSG